MLQWPLFSIVESGIKHHKPNLYSIFSEIFNHAEITTFSSSLKPHIKQKDMYMYLIYFWKFEFGTYQTGLNLSLALTKLG
jgi:ATP-dependent phosphoenolpyruvate carboxykinase